MAKNWAIAIGINQYENLSNLKYAVRDAKLMKNWFEDEARFDNVYLFTDTSPKITDADQPYNSQPNRATLRRFLRARFEKPFLSAGDNLWFFFSGHGMRHGNRDYLLPSDVDPHPDELESSAIALAYVTERLRKCGADNVVLILDACRDESRSKGLGIGEEKQQGVITIASCSPAESSYEIEDLQQGSFTYSLLQGLRIQGEGNCATVERLYSYLRNQVPEINRVYQKPRQTPYAIAEPASKYHLILLPEYIQPTLEDIARLREDALEAEAENNLKLAETLWNRLVKFDQEKSLRALKRIWEKLPQQDRARISRDNQVAQVDQSGQKTPSKVIRPRRNDSQSQTERIISPRREPERNFPFSLNLSRRRLLQISGLTGTGIGVAFLVEPMLKLISNLNDESTEPIQATNSDDYLWEPERFTKGQRTLFPRIANASRDNGIQAFKNQNYGSAVEFFKRAVDANRNDPEVLILYNNALARQQGNGLTLAAVVPVDGNATSAEEMLRGIAMAQNQFNESGGANGQLLEIVIANDGNNPVNAKQVAQQLGNDPSILGVVGHNSSSASAAGLEIYEQNGLAMVSPTSTSTSLESPVFFRAVPSDSAVAEELAQYVETQLGLTKAVVFYNPRSSYSNSISDVFTNNFSGTVVKKIDISDPNVDIKGKLYPIILEEKAQAALLFPNTSYASVAIEIARANANIPTAQRLKLLGGDVLYSSTTLVAGSEAVEGLVLAVPWFRESPKSQKFKTDSENQWGGHVSWRTAISYDATKAFIEVLSTNPNPDRATVLKGLAQVQLPSNETSGDEVRFTSQGERQSESVLVKVTRGASNRPQGSDFGFELVR